MLTQAEYNAKVQDMQWFCIECGMEHRVRPVYPSKVGTYGQREVIPASHPERALFEVFYGDWRRLGRQEKPMMPDADFYYDDVADMKVRAEVARDLSR